MDTVKTNNSDKVISWNPSSITRIVSNRVYLGEMIYGKRSTNIAGNSSIIRHPQEEWKVIKNHHEAIVSEELFEQANKMLHGPKKRDTSKKKHVLVGKMICGGCGYALSFKPKASYCKYSRFECSRHSLLKIPECCTHFKADILEEIVLKRLNQELMIWGDSYQQAGNMEAHYESVLRSLKDELRDNKLEIENVQAAKKSLYESYALSDMTAEEYKEQSSSLTMQLESLQEKLGELQEKISVVEQEYDVKKEDMKKIIRYSHMEELTEEIVDTFIKKIYLYHDKSVEIEWMFGEKI
ncbi:MAG: recombinase family protein [Lachnospiraceae bacterium]|nr:recombinase family protein [Lachnospiraceae bacterium]